MSGFCSGLVQLIIKGQFTHITFPVVCLVAQIVWILFAKVLKYLALGLLTSTIEVNGSSFVVVKKNSL